MPRPRRQCIGSAFVATRANTWHKRQLTQHINPQLACSATELVRRAEEMVGGRAGGTHKVGLIQEDSRDLCI